MAELARQQFFQVIYTAVEQVPIIGGLIGDIVEILTGVEDGDLNDFGSWVNGLASVAQVFTAVADGIGQFIHDLLNLLDAATGGIFNVDALAEAFNTTHATAATAQSTVTVAPSTAIVNVNNAVTQAQAAANATVLAQETAVVLRLRDLEYPADPTRAAESFREGASARVAR